jgi:hypothetical protein
VLTFEWQALITYASPILSYPTCLALPRLRALSMGIVGCAYGLGSFTAQAMEGLAANHISEDLETRTIQQPLEMTKPLACQAGKTAFKARTIAQLANNEVIVSIERTPNKVIQASRWWVREWTFQEASYHSAPLGSHRGAYLLWMQHYGLLRDFPQRVI